MNIAASILRPGQTAPESVCLRSLDREGNSFEPDLVRYRELDEVSHRLACQLAELGVKPSDRVVVQVEKSLSAVLLYLAVLRMGAVFVPLNVGYGTREVAYFVADSEPTLIVSDDSTRATLQGIALDASVALARLGRRGSDPDESDACLDPWSRGLTEGAQLNALPIWDSAPSDLAAILYTSGTTGRSKGAMLTHDNLLSNARTLCRIWRITKSDVLVHVLPIFHVHGLFVALNTVLSQGAEVLFMREFDAGAAVRALAGATLFMGVPTHYTRLLECAALDANACATMRLFTSGSAPLDPVTFDAFAERTGHWILERYGMTEAGMMTSNPYRRGSGLDRNGFARGERVAGSVGFALPQVSVEVIDESGECVEPGVVGRLRVRGPNVFAGYWKQKDKTAESLSADGWLDSGDLATCDETGRICLVGRSTDMIIVGGYNVYPREIEDCLLELDGVGEAAVFGVPHPVMGEGVVACLVPSVAPGSSMDSTLVNQCDADAIRSALSNSLAEFKHPRKIEWLACLPRNAMGKVQKTVLKQRYAHAYGAIDEREMPESKPKTPIHE